MTQHLHPSSWAEAATLLAARPGAVVVGGGTGLQPWLTAAVHPPEALVHLDRVPGARATRHEDGRLALGALVPVADPALEPWWGSEGPGWFATPAVRRRATVVGNLASGLGPRELGPLAVATAGVAEVWDAAGPRTVPVAELLATGVGRGVVAAVALRVPERISYHRVSARARLSRVELGLCVARGPGCGAALVVGVGTPALPLDPDPAGLASAVVRAGIAAAVPADAVALLVGLAERVERDLSPAEVLG